MFAMTRVKLIRLFCLPLFGVLLTLTTATAGELEEQRQAFRHAYAEAELGNWKLTADEEALLRHYVLWPDLRAAWLRTRIGRNDAEIKAFLERYGNLKPARELRYRYTLALAGQQRWDAFLPLYDRYYRQLGVAQLDCLALRAEFDELTPSVAMARARELWLVGHSQHKACDPLFARLNARGMLDEALYRERFALAVEARELAIARYLARSLPEQYQQEARRWTRAYGLPHDFLDKHDKTLQSATYRRQLLAAVKQVAYNDAEAAGTYWQAIRPHHAFSAAEQDDAARHVALWLARNHRAGAYAALLALPDSAVDTEVLRWRVRSALRQGLWTDVLEHVDALPDTERTEPQWQYWRAVALQQSGHADAAMQSFGALADDRSYYGFLAADAVGSEYAFAHEPIAADEAVLARLAARDDLVRARELFMVGLDGRGRAEWDAAVAAMKAEEQVQAAVLAHRWGWHSRAIATAALNQRYDDLDLRFPTPYAEAFDTHARAAGVRPSWALGIARSESLFMPDIRSSAGAIGVMQLMPATGRLTAREIKLPYRGRATLTDPVNNIRLGTWFLGNMQTRFAQHPALATAAYNAGPRRVEDWLPDGAAMDARIWIENIPYAETRGYVRRVLMADAIFHWRLAGETSRLSERLPDIPPREFVAKLAAD